MTGSRSSTSGAHSRSVHYSAQSSPAKRRRPNDTDSEASSIAGGAVARTRIAQQASASGRVTVDEVDLDGKYVRLSNKSDEVGRGINNSIFSEKSFGGFVMEANCSLTWTLCVWSIGTYCLQFSDIFIGEYILPGGFDTLTFYPTFRIRIWGTGS